MKALSGLLALLSVFVMASTLTAQPYNARGTFNGWGETPMNDDGDGTYSITIGGLTPGNFEEFKVAENDWASSWPGSDAKVPADANGDLTIHFQPGAVADGWNPAADRVGYDDPGQFGWEIMGSFNNWDDGIDTAARQMTDMGGGLYSVDYTIASPDNHFWKFRNSNTWDQSSIGDDFGNAAANNEVTTTNPNEVHRFELDLPNGRWRSFLVPEPCVAGAGLLCLGAYTLLRRRRTT